MGCCPTNSSQLKTGRTKPREIESAPSIGAACRFRGTENTTITATMKNEIKVAQVATAGSFQGRNPYTFPLMTGSALRNAVALLVAMLSLGASMPSAEAAIFIVNSTADTDDGTCNSANCTLREAINAANNTTVADTILLTALSGTINLTSALPDVINALNLTGPGADILTLQGSGSFRILNVAAGAVSVTVTKLTITNGSATGGGGGIRSLSPLSVTDCVLSGNSATTEGGAVSLAGGGGQFRNCTFSSNTAGQRGGAIYYDGEGGFTLTLINDTISGNHANGGGNGGAIFHFSNSMAVNPPSTLQVTNCTITNNFSASSLNGGGIAAAANSAGDDITTLLSNTIVAGNTAPNLVSGAGAPGASSTFVSQGYNLTSDDGNGLLNATGDLVNSDPRLGPLQDNGGPSFTHLPSINGAAVDAGNTTQPFDQRGVGFISRPQGARDDIGAVEVALEEVVVTTTVDEDNGSIDPGLGTGTSLREAIAFTNANVTGHPAAILFDLPASQQVGGVWTIDLVGALPQLFKSVLISGPGADLLTVQRSTGGDYRIFDITFPDLQIAMADLTIGNGRVSGNGGAIRSVSPLTLTRCAVAFNTTTGSGSGGGIYLEGADGAFNDCTFRGNVSGTGGGGAIAFFSQGAHNIRLANCTLSGNGTGTGGTGGGVLSVGGGGQGNVHLTNCTLAANSSSGGGGLQVTAVGSGNIAAAYLTNSIFASNTPQNIAATMTGGGSGGVVSFGHNLASDIGGGFLNQSGDQINTDPMLGPLQDNGGTTETHAILETSAAYGAGDDTRAPVTDQRAHFRQGTSDIGAFELTFPVQLSSAESVKTHGGAGEFGIDLLAGSPAVECRSGAVSGEHTIVFHFPGALSSVGGVDITGAGSVSSSDFGTTAQEYVVELTGVTNAQVINVSLLNVRDSQNNQSEEVSVAMGVLLGDTTGNGSVTSSDVSLTKLRSGQVVDSSNFRNDVNVSNSISATDVSSVKLKVGTALPQNRHRR